MKVTQEMLTEAMKKAVELELFPKHVGDDLYLKHWEGMKKVLETAFQYSNAQDACGCPKFVGLGTCPDMTFDKRCGLK